MKSLVLVLFAVIALTANAFNGTIGRSASLSYDGSVVAESIEYQSINVKNTHSAALSKGMAVVLDTSADDGASVLISTTSGLSPLCIMEKACAVNAICPCQVYGKFDEALFDSTAANAVAGKRFYMSTNNAGYLSARGTEVATEAPGGVFYDAASASGSIQVFIK